MGTYTIPQICYDVRLDADAGPHIIVEYADLTTDSISIGASGGTTYYADGSTGDLLSAIASALTAGALGTWTCAYASGNPFGRVRITQVGGGKTASILTFPTSALTAESLGLSLTAGAGQSAALAAGIPGSASRTGSYRTRWLWSPDDICTRSEPIDIYTDIVRYNPRAAGIWDSYGGFTAREIFVPRLWGALVKPLYSADSDHAANAGIAVGDPNAAWDAWIRHLRSDKANGPIPDLRVAYDRTDPDTFTVSRIIDQRFLERPSNATPRIIDGPLQYALELLIAEVP